MTAPTNPSVSITKLTPPQIAAVRESLPGMVGLGVITWTNSIVRLQVPEKVTISGDAIRGGGSWQPTVAKVTALIASAHERTGDRRLLPVLAKLRDADAKHLRVS